jgi:hypothetical protein
MAGNGAVVPADSQDAAWRGLVSRHDIQFDFPDAPAIPPTPLWLRHLLEFLGRHAVWFKWGGWILLGAAVLAVGYFLVRHLLQRGFSQAGNFPLRPMPAWQPTAEQARLLLRDADSLAAQNRFEEAAHLLLLVAIQEIGDRRPGLILPALTSREIATLDALSLQARQVFSHIALVVERCIFGSRALSANDYAEVRSAFQQFTVPQAWQAAA